MRKKYLFINPIAILFFTIIDFILHIFIGSKKQKYIQIPTKILLANSAHLGDIVISTSLLPVLKNVFPNVKIGFIVGSWSEKIIRNHPLVDFIHIVDHWFLNRSKRSFFYKVKLYWNTKKTALREIRRIGYNVAIDLYSYFPNFIPLLWKSGIPVRIGYVSGGFGSLLTHRLQFQQSDKHELYYQSELLKLLPLDENYFQKSHPLIPIFSKNAETEVCSLLGVSNLDNIRYRIVHMGTSGSVVREWPLASWRSLIERLTSEGNTLLFTGISQHERLLIDKVTIGLPHCFNACGKLSFEGFVEAIRCAELIYSIETSAGHIAAAVGTPCVSIYGGINDINRWKPFGKYCSLLTKPVPCAPCFRKKGCRDMNCIRGINPSQVYNAGEELLRISIKTR